MTPINTLKAIRKICENAPDPDEKLYVGDFERLVTRYDEIVDKVYRLCLDALEPHRTAAAECSRNCDDPACPYMHTPEPSKAELVDIVRLARLDEATIKAQRESWAKGDMD